MTPDPSTITTPYTHFPNRYRLGDTIALYDLAAFIRHRTDGERTFSVGRERVTDESRATALPLLESMATEKGLFVNQSDDPVIFDDGFLWVWNDYLRSINFRVEFEPVPFSTDELPTPPDIVFAPLLDVEYSFERAMHIRFVVDLIRELPTMGTTVVLVAPDTTIADRQRIVEACSEVGAIPVEMPLPQVCRLIATTGVFLGGDTGLTHFAGHVMSTGVVTLHDRGKTERHTERVYDHIAPHRGYVRRCLAHLTGADEFRDGFPTYYAGPNRNEGARQILFDNHGCDGVTLDATLAAIEAVRSVDCRSIKASRMEVG